jgi:hypothetical protein
MDLSVFFWATLGSFVISMLQVKLAARIGNWRAFFVIVLSLSFFIVAAFLLLR